MAERLVGLIPAAGLGTRVRPYSAHLPKSMLPINGIPNLQRIVELMRDQLDIREIVIVTGYCAEVIEDHFGDGRASGYASISFATPTWTGDWPGRCCSAASISGPSSASSSRTSATWPPTTTNCSRPAGGARLPPAG